MTDLLKLAHERGERLVEEIDEISDIVKHADSFFRGIDKYRSEVLDGVEDIDDFFSSAYIVLEEISKKKSKLLQELAKIESFIEVGADLIKEHETSNQTHNPEAGADTSGGAEDDGKIEYLNKENHQSPSDDEAAEKMRWPMYVLHKNKQDDENNT